MYRKINAKDKLQTKYNPNINDSTNKAKSLCFF